jgi:hypothetical protein
LETFGAIWSHLEQFGVISTHLEPAIWSQPFGAIWSHLEPDMEPFNIFFLWGGAFFALLALLNKDFYGTFLAPFGLFVGLV